MVHELQFFKVPPPDRNLFCLGHEEFLKNFLIPQSSITSLNFGVYFFDCFSSRLFRRTEKLLRLTEILNWPKSLDFRPKI